MVLSRFSHNFNSLIDFILVKAMYEEASQVANDAVSSIRTVASFCAEGKVMDLYQQKCDGPKKNGVRLGLLSGAGFGFSFFFLYCINCVCFVSGAGLVQIGKATFGEVFKVRRETFLGLIKIRFGLVILILDRFFST